MTDPTPKERLDKWLYHARFFKTRTLAAKVVTGGHVRVNKAKVAKASYGVSVGDVLTFPQAKAIRVVRVEGFAERRGPASEAQVLYSDLSEVKDNVPCAPRYEGNGRPTKRDRRKLDLKRGQELE
ncbi:heat shock protein Hsp15 [Shimia gijangensis]|uniref:Heat shock protein Hsp15 n=1 Tax=Shimia gijangensis TaxID=1470563 RepID=A0A1M6J4I1_9RHOB|nr:RNA-binding S4 domain-containing protein [Shimia gijangensis]SHJ41579.1 heat shock protein Hsp15 [Shimia gijangensis]